MKKKEVESVAKQYVRLAILADIFCGFIEAGQIPAIGSGLHQLAEKAVKDSGWKSVRKRRPMPKMKKAKK